MSLSPTPHKPTSPTIDRQLTTPFLLTLCYKSSGFHNLHDFPLPSPSNPTPPLPSHLQIYTWMSCTLRELAHLLTMALPNIMPNPCVGTRLGFRLVFPDVGAGMERGGGGRLEREEMGRGRWVVRDVGSLVVGAKAGHENGKAGEKHSGWELDGEDADKTLEDVRFVIGDFVDVAVFPPLGDGSVVGRAAVGGGGRGRENGFGGGRGRGGGGPPLPSGEWRRGERQFEERYRGGGGGYGGRGRGRY